MTCPCGVCEIRHVGCHAECEAYQKWRAEYAEQSRAAYLLRTGEDILDDFRNDALRKQRRRRR